MILCRCNSKLPSRELFDARGIYVTRVCDDCERSVRKKYRAEIFTDPHYHAEEPIEPD